MLRDCTGACLSEALMDGQAAFQPSALLGRWCDDFWSSGQWSHRAVGAPYEMTRTGRLAAAVAGAAMMRSTLRWLNVALRLRDAAAARQFVPLRKRAGGWVSGDALTLTLNPTLDIGTFLD